jgi:hypothetical protein
MLAGALFAAGLMSFELISYHLSTTKTVTDHWIPVFLAISSAFGVIAMQAWSDAVMEAYKKAGGRWPQPYPPPKPKTIRVTK